MFRYFATQKRCWKSINAQLFAFLALWDCSKLVFCFFLKISQRLQKMTFQFFHILQQTGFSKSPNDPPFTHFQTLRTLSRRYSTDSRPSHLVFCRCFSTENSSTITVTSFYYFFVWPQTLSCMYHFLQTSLVSTVFTQFTLSPCFSQKLFRDNFFCATQFFGALRHFSNFLNLQMVASSVFLIFCSKLKCQKAQRVSTFFHLCYRRYWT